MHPNESKKMNFVRPGIWNLVRNFKSSRTQDIIISFVERCGIREERFSNTYVSSVLNERPTPLVSIHQSGISFHQSCSHMSQCRREKYHLLVFLLTCHRWVSNFANFLMLGLLIVVIKTHPLFLCWERKVMSCNRILYLFVQL